jgi:hypothetical protein
VQQNYFKPPDNTRKPELQIKLITPFYISLGDISCSRKWVIEASGGEAGKEKTRKPAH